MFVNDTIIIIPERISICDTSWLWEEVNSETTAAELSLEWAQLHRQFCQCVPNRKEPKYGAPQIWEVQLHQSNNPIIYQFH